MQQLFRYHYCLTLPPDFGEVRQGHIFYVVEEFDIHFTANSHESKYVFASKVPGVPAVKKSLSSPRLWCLLNSECLAPWLRCTQQLFIPVRRVLAPQLFFCAAAGGSDLLHAYVYVTIIIRITNKHLSKSQEHCFKKNQRKWQKYPKSRTRGRI